MYTVLNIFKKIPLYLLSFFDIISDLRLHVIFNFFLLCSWFLYSLKVPSNIAITYSIIITLFNAYTYLLNRYSDYNYDLIVDDYFKKPPRILYYILAIIFLNLGIFLFFYYKDLLGFNYYQILILILLGIFFAITYSFKTFFKYPFKNYLITKNLYTVGTKFFGIIIGALLLSPFSYSTILIMSVAGICLNLITTILWDVRDMRSDPVGMVKTIPTTIGKERTLILCLVILLLSLLFITLFGFISSSFFIRYFIMLFFIISVIKIEHPRWFHVMVYVHVILNIVFSNEEIKVLLQDPNTIMCK